jgi:MinD-like ATPase involved in chromosome partitioning or flagellar assembly
MQLRTLVVDADLGNADVSNKLRLYPRKTLADYLHKRNEIEEIVMQTEFGFDVLPGKTGEVALATMKYFQRIRFMNAFARVSDLYDFVIYDLGAGLNLQIMDFALCADDFVIVTTPRDMMSAYACAKFAFYRHHELETRYAKKQEDYQVRSRFEPWLVINQVVNNTQGNLVFKTLCNTASNLANSQDQVILQGFQLVPRHLGTVPLESKGFLAAEEYHQPFSKLYPHSPIVEHYRTISRFLTDPLNRSNTSALQVIGEMESEAKDDTQDLQPS